MDWSLDRHTRLTSVPQIQVHLEPQNVTPYLEILYVDLYNGILLSH